MSEAQYEYQWANEKRVNGMPTPEELETEGYERIRRHPWWPISWLMRRAIA